MKIYIVVDGGCVRYVASNSQKIEVEVIDLDDLRDEPDLGRQALLELVEILPRIW